jgi:hypothetical protein
MFERLPQIAIGALVLAGITVGVIATGGPERGRAERRDKDRQSDIRSLAYHVECLTGPTGQLPDDLTPTDTCPANGVDFKDETDKPYTYQKVTESEYLLCAAYEYPAALWGNLEREGLDRTTGCQRFDKN